MERHFDEELNELKKNILKMAVLAGESVEKAAEAIADMDIELAEKVISGDNQVDMLELEIDRQCLELLAKRQPMAVDLRIITSLQKINNDLERIGDLGINMANSGIYLAKHPPLVLPAGIPKMAEEACRMLKEAMASIVNTDANTARNVCEQDRGIDELYVKVFRETLAYMMEDSGNIKRGIRLILIAKNIERVADHVTNIAEDIVYMLEGKTIKHHFE